MKFYSEIFDKPYSYRYSVNDRDLTEVVFTTDEGKRVSVKIIVYDNRDRPENAEVIFFVDGRRDMTGGGDAFRILATVIEIMAEYMDKYQDVMEIQFRSYEYESSRMSLYQKLARKHAQGYDVEVMSGRGDTQLSVLRR